jgi:hypothetical protein
MVGIAHRSTVRPAWDPPLSSAHPRSHSRSRSSTVVFVGLSPTALAYPENLIPPRSLAGLASGGCAALGRPELLNPRGARSWPPIPYLMVHILGYRFMLVRRTRALDSPSSGQSLHPQRVTAPGSPLSVACPASLISAVDPRSNDRRSPIPLRFAVLQKKPSVS